MYQALSPMDTAVTPKNLCRDRTYISGKGTNIEYQVVLSTTGGN